MGKKPSAKARGKRLARALGACRRCARLAALKAVVADRPGVMHTRCPACARELRVSPAMLNDGDRVVIRRFAECLHEGEAPCPHRFTVVLDGRAVREDPPCDCGRPRAVLNMHSQGGEADGELT